MTWFLMNMVSGSMYMCWLSFNIVNCQMREKLLHIYIYIYTCVVILLIDLDIMYIMYTYLTIIS